MPDHNQTACGALKAALAELEDLASQVCPSGNPGNPGTAGIKEVKGKHSEAYWTGLWGYLDNGKVFGMVAVLGQETGKARVFGSLEEAEKTVRSKVDAEAARWRRSEMEYGHQVFLESEAAERELGP